MLSSQPVVFMSKMYTGGLIMCMLLMLGSGTAKSASVFRDSEVENVIKKVSLPLLEVANINADEVKVFIVDDNSVNAYVTPDNHIFIHKGLLKFSKDPSVVVGVLAHEIGHISQHHLIKRAGEHRQEAIVQGIGYLLGIAAALVEPKIAPVIVAGSSTISQRMLLAHSRTQEEAADQLALEYLDAAGYSHEGLLQVLRYFSHDEAQAGVIDEYILTHPLSETRIRKVVGYSHKRKIVGFTREDMERFSRIVDKTEAFLTPLDSLTRRPLSPYMQSIVRYRIADAKGALMILSELIAAAPTDPYLREIRAQIFYKLGDINSCVADYKAALALLPDDTLIKLELAQALLIKDPQQAIPYLEHVSSQERDNPYVWNQLAIAYGRTGRVGMSYFALAHRYFFEGNKGKFLAYVVLARKHLDRNSLQSQIINELAT